MALLMHAFLHLDFSIWLTPNEDDRRAELTNMFAVMLDDPKNYVEVTEDMSAVAIWEPPEAADEGAGGKRAQHPRHQKAIQKRGRWVVE